MNPSRVEDYRLDQVDLELMCGPLEPSAGELHDWRAERDDRANDHCPSSEGRHPSWAGRRSSSFLDNGVSAPAALSSLSPAGAGTPTYPEDR